MRVFEPSHWAVMVMNKLPPFVLGNFPSPFLYL